MVSFRNAPRMPRRQIAMLRLKTAVRLSAGVEKKYRMMITGTSIAASGVTINAKVNDGRITSMKFVPGGGRGIADTRSDIEAVLKC